MPQSSTLQVTLPQDLLDFLQTKVQSGEYTSESEVIRDVLATLQDKDAGFELWAREEVVPAYNLLVKDPSRGVTIAQARANFESRFRASGEPSE